MLVGDTVGSGVGGTGVEIGVQDARKMRANRERMMFRFFMMSPDVEGIEVAMLSCPGINREAKIAFSFPAEVIRRDHPN